ncbi:MAG: FAD-dependent oxidoreductase [Candidatus Daviesbacteria bacterium]
MKIAVLGAGFTGLATSLRLLQDGHQVTLFEKENQFGGLAGGFRENSWQWSLEKSYHHFFTNDQKALNLAKEVGQEIIINRPKTDVLVNNQILPLDTPMALLFFPFLPLVDKLRMGLITLYLRIINNFSQFNQIKALPWLKKYMGEKAVSLIWEPLFMGKFGKHQENISLTWFWARIKKRTTSLAYPKGGFESFAQKLAKKIEDLGGEILLNTEVLSIGKDLTVYSLPSTAKSRSRKPASQRGESEVGSQLSFDKIIVTLPTPTFLKISSPLPKTYSKKLSSISHLSALILILTLKKPFLKSKTYWLNITNPSFPFLVLTEHTNFMSPKYYGNHPILYIGNYLPEDHPYFKKTKEELLKIYEPYLKKINPFYDSGILSLHSFTQPNAQPIVNVGHDKLIPSFQTPLKNVYLANLDMVYPWDRGVNNAIEMGEKVAKLINEQT